MNKCQNYTFIPICVKFDLQLLMFKMQLMNWFCFKGNQLISWATQKKEKDVQTFLKCGHTTNGFCRKDKEDQTDKNSVVLQAPSFSCMCHNLKYMPNRDVHDVRIIKLRKWQDPAQTPLQNSVKLLPLVFNLQVSVIMYVLYARSRRRKNTCSACSSNNRIPRLWHINLA